MSQSEWLARLAVGLAAIDGMPEPAGGSLDSQSAWRLSRRLSYVLLRPVTPDDVSAIAVDTGRGPALSLDRNRAGLTVPDCIEEVTSALERFFGTVVRSVPVPALLRYADLSETKAWRRMDGMLPVEVFAIVRRYTGVKNLWSRSEFACEFPILEMGHALFLTDSLSGKYDHAKRIARVMQWPEGGPEDLEALVCVVLECLAVLLGIPFFLCSPSTPLVAMLQYCTKPSKYWPLETRVEAAVAALTWLWVVAERKKADHLLRTAQRCLKDGQSVADWVAKWA
jgi:hypothetical protein